MAQRLCRTAAHVAHKVLELLLLVQLVELGFDFVARLEKLVEQRVALHLLDAGDAELVVQRILEARDSTECTSAERRERARVISNVHALIKTLLLQRRQRIAEQRQRVAGLGL